MRLLVAVSRYPWPARRGDQLRTLAYVQALAGHADLTLVTPAPPSGAPAPPADLPARWVSYTPPTGARVALRLAAAAGSGAPFQNALFSGVGLHRELARLRTHHDGALLQLSRLADALPALGGLPLVVDLIDSLALNLRRRAALDTPFLRPLLHAEANRVARTEHRLVAASRHTLVVAERDRADLTERLSADLSARLQVVPLPVPLAPARPEPAGPPVLVLTGNLGYFPTVEGADWFLTAVWPRVRAAFPAARVVLAGARPARVLRSAARWPGVELLADPPDLGAVFSRATVALAPLRAGSGQPLKVLEAWAHGVPVLTTPWTASGTTGRAGEDFLLAESADEWVRALDTLLREPARRLHLAANARERLAAEYGVERLAARLRVGVLGPFGG